jgi:hypothetical protein
MIIVALASALSVGVLASPAFALKEKPVFGKFKATAAGSVKGHGESGEMVLGPYRFEECEKELESKGSVTLGESETFFQEVSFKDCVGAKQLAGGLEERETASFKLGLEFHSNGALVIGPSAVTFGVKGSSCEITIPSQSVPTGFVKHPEKPYEVASYSTETEKLEGAMEKKFGEFRERLDIEWELKGITTTIKLTPKCMYGGSRPLNAAGEAEYTNGRMEGELEEVTLKTGNLAFVPAL